MKLNCWTERKANEWKAAIEANLHRCRRDIAKPNIRLASFAPLRSDTLAHWFVDGSSYMSAVADAMEAAREEIFITDWFFSPQLYLKRPIDFTDRWRLDKLLQRKAVSWRWVFGAVIRQRVS